MINSDEDYWRWMREYPARAAQQAEIQAAARVGERAGAQQVELTLDSLLAKLGWTRRYAEHAVQPYCSCWHDWSGCVHADDQEITPGAA